ncbi:MAG TPA: carboxypeptidase-like regulatory domain-containing protein [Blastocatellia bacterium]|nr:carboxypeptidase-like regulatory domain-containing protein [Blastocatellia bacterium]
MKNTGVERTLQSRMPALPVVFLLLIVTAITSHAQTKGAITGRVVADDGSGMAGVTVALHPATAQGGQGRSTTTDEDGNFRFTDLPSRPYGISVFSTREYAQPPILTASGERLYYRIGEHVRIALIRGGVITGRVTNAGGEPVIGIQVIATRVRDAEGRPLRTPSGSSQKMTDDRGVYRIYGLSPGAYIVVANSNSNYSGGLTYYGETPTYHPSSTRDTAAEVTVAAGSEVSGIDIRYRGEPGHAISGRLSGADQAGSGASMMVYLSSAATGGSYDLRYIDSSQGAAPFALYGVADGEYDLTAERFIGRGDDGLVSQPRRITVRGADVTGIELKLTPRSSIAGKVVLDPAPQRCNEKNPPSLEEIVIQARRDDEYKAPLPSHLSFPRDATPDDKGEFLFKPVDPARYRLRVSLPGESLYLKSMTASSAAPAGGAGTAAGTDIARGGIQLKPGERLSGVTIKVAEGAASLRGKVAPQKEGAQAPAKMVVHLVPMETASADDVLRYAEVSAGRDGTFEFKNIAPGKYRILARPAPDDDPIDRLPAPVAWDTNERTKLRKAAEALKIEIELKHCQRIVDQTVKYSIN